MTAVLAVPVRLDALFLDQDRVILPPTADFSKLPYRTSHGDVNPDVAWLSEEIVPQPFEGPNFILKAGLHLHWALPDSFLRGTNHGLISLDVNYARGLLSGQLSANLLQDLKHEGVVLSDKATLSSGGVIWHISERNQSFTIRAQRAQPGRAVLHVGGTGIRDSISMTLTDYDLRSLDWGVLTESLLKAFEREGVALSNKAQIEKETLWQLDDAEQDERFAVRWRQQMTGRRRQTLRLHSTGIVFPAAPNRWLVRRKWKDEVHRWVVESDRLDLDDGYRQSPVWFPAKSADGRPPCRRLGGVLEFDGWKEKKETEPDQYLPRLTAVGFGDPTFAAFYPNCHSVFGFHDPDIAGGKGGVADLEYQVVGWHSHPADDPLRTTRFEDAFKLAGQRYGLDADSCGSAMRDALFEEALEAVHGWTVGLPKLEVLMRQGEPRRGDGHGRPERAVVLGSIGVKLPPEAPAPGDNENRAKCVVAIGHTVTEALSAYVAANLPRVPGDKATLDQATIEDQIEALHLTPRLDGLRIDIGPKFREARHEKEFAAVDAGRRWTIVPRDPAASTSGPVTLDPALSEALKRLNKTEANLDRASGELASLRRRLYSDWCKYMICAYPPLGVWEDYPDMDAVRAFIEGVSLREVTLKLADRRKARRARDEERDKLRDKLDPLLAKLPLTLKPRPASRFWRPKEPVVLIAGDSVSPSLRHGKNDLLGCEIKDLEPPLDGTALLSAKHIEALAEQAARLPPGAPGRSDCREQPWHPVFLDWRVEMLPWLGASNVSPETRRYTPDFVKSKFTFKAERADLQPNDIGRPHDPDASTVYQGRSILTPHAGTRLRLAIEAWMCKRLSLDPSSEQDVTRARGELASLAKRAAADGADPALTIARAYGFLFGEMGQTAARFMAQALTGFNAALLMQRQTMQLPIADPLGFAEDRAFTDIVARAVAGENITAPQPLNEFHPIRTGGLRIRELRLVDTFGQARTLAFDPDALITAESMTIKERPHTALLRPRIVQPARVKFRWLAANNPADLQGDLQAEANDHSTALCGWVVHDLSANGLLVHAADGAPIGRISDRQWHGAPGVQRIAPWQIANSHLARLTVSLLQDERLGDFLAELDDHLGTIIPDEFAEHDGVQLLLGRPLAVVRARLELQLYGLPATNQDWNVFRSELRAGVPPARTHDRFDEVKFEIRLGDEDQLNDGLAAFWVEVEHPDGRCTLKGPARTSAERKDVELSIAGGEAVVTMLIDPRAPVHARSGVLPAKSIALPKAHYAEILSRMSVALPVGPFLCSEDRLALYAPDTTRFATSWVERDRGQWLEAPIGVPAIAAEWSAPIGIREGWIKLTPKTAE